VYGKDSYSLGVVKYWGREFKAQRTDLHDEVRPGRPFSDISAQIARLLNDEPFSSTRDLARQLAVTKEVVKRDLQEVLGFHKLSLKWVPNVLSAEQKAARVQMSRELYNNLIFQREKKFTTIITGDESWISWSYAQSSIWARSRDDVLTSQFHRIDSKKSMFAIFFSGEKLAFLDSLPRGQNMDFYYFCNTILEGIKASDLVGARKATLRDFHIQIEICKVHNSRLTKGKLDEIQLTRWDHPHIHPILHPRTFDFSGGAKER
jgi:hypothetical protein